MIKVYTTLPKGIKSLEVVLNNQRYLFINKGEQDGNNNRI